MQLDVGGIVRPNADGSCQHFDPAALEMVLSDLTQQRTLVTGVQGGGNLCEVSACSPSPCRNQGQCTLNAEVVGGYECSCRQGFTGVNCTLDEPECAEGAFL